MTSLYFVEMNDTNNVYIPNKATYPKINKHLFKFV